MNSSSCLLGLRPRTGAAPARSVGFRPIWLRPARPEPVQKLSALVASHLRPAKKARYSLEQRQRALQRAAELGLAGAARELGIPVSTLRGWRRRT